MERTKGELSPALIIGLMITAFVVMVLRRPDIITNAQPWAEDGKIWLAAIYNDGFWHSLLLPQNGYYQTISRLTYGASLLFGISNAALASNVIAILVRVAFCAFILSRRMSFAPIWYRIAAVIYLILMPNLDEGYVNITNIHWYLSMYLMAIVMAEDAESGAWKVHDYIVMIVSSLSGPFVVFIAPCLLIKRIYQRGGFVNAVKGINAFDIIMAVCCVIQVSAILMSPETARSSAPLGATVGVLIKIIAYRIVAGSLFSNDMISFMPDDKWLSLLLFIVFIVPAVFLFLKEGWRYKVAMIFPVLMIGFAMAKPMMSITEPQWPVFFGPVNGQRYFFVTNFAFYCYLLFVAFRLSRYTKVILPAMAVITIAVLIPSFSMLPMPESGFRQDIEKFNDAPQGERMDIRINPPGWTMTLIKK